MMGSRELSEMSLIKSSVATQLYSPIDVSICDHTKRVFTYIPFPILEIFVFSPGTCKNESRSHNHLQDDHMKRQLSMESLLFVTHLPRSPQWRPQLPCEANPSATKNLWSGEPHGTFILNLAIQLESGACRVKNHHLVTFTNCYVTKVATFGDLYLEFKLKWRVFVFDNLQENTNFIFSSIMEICIFSIT